MEKLKAVFSDLGYYLIGLVMMGLVIAFPFFFFVTIPCFALGVAWVVSTD